MSLLTSHCYTEGFFAELRDGVGRSAAVVVPLVLELVPVRSVVDVGCGEGAWLAEFQRLGVNEVLGIDGQYVDRKALRIAPSDFKPMDLSKPVILDRTFDLAISLEVAEHLDAGVAEQFVESLTRLAPVVLFSAAIPFQGGTHHVNEQWPDVWCELFRKRRYVYVDCIRPQIWENTAVEWWYAQNMLLFVESEFLQRAEHVRLRKYSANNLLCLVHPRNYLSAIQPVRAPDWRVSSAWDLFLLCLGNGLRRRARKLFGSNSGPDLQNPPNLNAAVKDAAYFGIVRRSGWNGHA